MIQSANMGGLRFGLAVVMALVFSAIFSMSFFHEGTVIGQCFTKKIELNRVKDAEAIADPQMKPDGDEVEEAASEDGFVWTERVRILDKGGILVLMTLAWLMLLPLPHQQRAVVYLMLGVYLTALSLCKSLNGDAAFSRWAMPAHATRWLSCLALGIWFFIKPHQKDSDPYRLVRWLLVIAVSMTFATHGMEALWLNPSFYDLLEGAGELFAISISESSCRVLLRIIGCMDLVLACSILFFKRRILFLWMAIWGGMTALSRPVAFGGILWEEALLRCGNALVPFLLFLWIGYRNDLKD